MASSPLKNSSTARSDGANLLGALLLMIALPPLTYYLWICVNAFGGELIVPKSLEDWKSFLARIPAPTVKAITLYLAWFLGQTLLQIAVPGKVRAGLPLADGSRLAYKMNDWFSFWFTMVTSVMLCTAGLVPATILHDEFGPLLTTANLFAFAFSVFLYWMGKRSPQSERTSANPFYEYFLGTALNPRVRGFDLKLFCEARPGLILWVLINFSLAAKQYQLHGRVSTAMILVVAFQFFYIADYFFHEEAILTTWDIKHENFGWMLCWGDLVWVPFTYTLQAFYLVHHPHELPVWATAAIIGLNMTGYAIFRGANIQKHKFRTDPTRPIFGKKPDYIETARGTPLLVSGWWGISRHMNYLGDLLMALAWCLPALFQHPLPYFYLVYFVILLVHRERRDSAMCHAKYGKDWERYCKRVRWRVIPGIY